MPETVSINKRLPKVPTQQRSRERFEFILDCAEALLGEGNTDELSIYDVAKRADLQAQSIYRLFPSATAINYALAQRYLDMMSEQVESADFGHCATWQDRLVHSLEIFRDFYKSNPLALELILGSEISKDVRAADRTNITRLANNAIRSLESHYTGLKLPIQQFEITIDIVDAIWSQSYYSHKEITPFYFIESIRASISYMELYLPRHFPSSDD
jgi:AcrR family transcriptional regulator